MIIMWCVLFLFSLPFKEDYRHTHKKPSAWANFWLSESIAYISNHAGNRVKVVSKVALPNERYLIVCNHRSKFDPMILTQLYGKKKLAFISKPSNFKIPIGHRFMWGSFYLSIDRYDKMQSLQILKDGAEYLEKGLTNVGVFPEGTRSETNELGPFHEGVFIMATKSQRPIVICSFMGTEKISKNFPKRPTKITLQILDVLYPKDYEGKIVKEISDYCYKVIKDSLTDI